MHFLSQNGELENNVEPYQRNFPNFIEAYLKFASHHEASLKIHLWSILSVLAASVERKICLDRGYYKLFPNLYVFIVGPSGIMKKSTSTGMAVSLLREISDVKIMSDRVTASSLIEQISSAKQKYDLEDGEETEHASMFIYASELIVFVKEVFGSVTELLTTFWDCPENWLYKTKHHGQVKLKGVCLNMLAATTIQWLKEGITGQVMSAGFAGRIVFVCEKNKPSKWVAWPEIPLGHSQTREKLIQDLSHIHSLQGEMKPTKEMKSFYTKWYQEHMEEVASKNRDERMNGYYGRKGEMALKIAMLYSLSKSDSMLITEEDLQWALKRLNELEKELIEIYEPPKPHAESDIKFKVLDHIHKAENGKIHESLLRFNLTHLSRLQIQKALEDLIMEERIKVLTGTCGVNGVYQMNQEIATIFDR